MSTPAEFNTQVMQWQPKLIQLTQLANPDWWDGKPTVAFVDPRLICSIVCTKGGYAKKGLPADAPLGYHTEVDCTMVRICGSSEIAVLESPEEVARLRDLALGHEPKKVEFGVVK